MKANSLEELVTNSNIAGELRNYTDWHTRLVKFAQLVADWQKEQNEVEKNLKYLDGLIEGTKVMKQKIMEEAVETEVWNYSSDEDLRAIPLFGIDKFNNLKDGDKVRIVVLKTEEE